MKVFLAATNSGMTKAQRAEVIKKYPPKYLLTTFYEGEKACLEAIRMVGNENFLLDSGAFSYMNGKQITKKDMDSYVKRYICFIKRYDIKYFFEMDVDSIFGIEAVERWRKQIEKETGKKCIPVWHKQRGVAYWKDMCREYDYVAIGGLVLGAKKQEYPLYKKLVEYAALRGIKVHGLGFTKTKILKEYPFYSVDSSSWSTGAVRGKQKHTFQNGIIVARQINSNGKKLKIEKLCAYNFSQWVLYQNYMEGVKVCIKQRKI